MKRLYKKIANMEQENFDTMMNIIVVAILFVGCIYALHRAIGIYSMR